MLTDLYFYPFAVLITVAMIVFALSFGESLDLSEEEILRAGYTMEGKDLARLAMQPGTQATFVAEANLQPAFARLTSTAARDSLPKGPGVFAPIGPLYEDAFAEKRLQMTITARSSKTYPLTTFDMGYFTAGSGDSGWKAKTLSSNWADYTIEFTPGKLTDKRGVDHFSIWPGQTAEMLNMDVLRMRIEVLDTLDN